MSGDNGSGKSTLLSLVCADNPQAYACDISLFGHKRGSGESIWDIKRHIGYVSPEMHRSYKQNIPAIQIVASGLKDTIGLYVRPNEAEREQCRKWLEVFGIGHLADRKFMEMSSGEQRLVLVARAFVKEPDLLILDEPLHGLDVRGLLTNTYLRYTLSGRAAALHRPLYLPQEERLNTLLAIHQGCCTHSRQSLWCHLQIAGNINQRCAEYQLRLILHQLGITVLSTLEAEHIGMMLREDE